jgi:hypothetical protein
MDSGPCSTLFASGREDAFSDTSRANFESRGPLLFLTGHSQLAPREGGIPWSGHRTNSSKLPPGYFTVRYYSACCSRCRRSRCSLHPTARTTKSKARRKRGIVPGDSEGIGAKSEAGGTAPASLPYFALLTLLVGVCRVWSGSTRARQPPRLLSLAKSGAYLSGSSLSNSQQSCSIFRLPLDAQRYLSK